MRRLWNVAVLGLAVVAVRAAEAPMMVEKNDCPFDPSCDCGAWFTLAGSGMHVPALLVSVFAALGVLATFAPAPSPIPRASSRRDDTFRARLCGHAHAHVAALIDARRVAIGLAVITATLLGLLTWTCGGPGAQTNSTAQMLLAVVLALGWRGFGDHTANRATSR
jgi:hypothetical protein